MKTAILRMLRRHEEPRPLLVHPMVGKVVMDVQLDGCMAHVATIKRVGEIVAVKTHEALWGRPMIGGIPGRRYEYAVCRVVHPEFRTSETEAETFNAPLFDSWFQPAPGGGNVWVWRH